MSDKILKMPRLGETMEEGVIVGWLIDVGQSFERGEPLIEVETDKTIVEFPALGAGTLTEQLAADGETIPVGEPIAKVKIEAGVDWTIDNNDAAEETEKSDGEENLDITTNNGSNVATSNPSSKLRATPAARKLARNNSIELETIDGCGRRDRVEKSDVENAISGNISRLTNKTLMKNDIAYIENNGSSGESYLLVHGFAGDKSTFSLLFNALSKAGHHVIALDLPAHGETLVSANTVDELSKKLDPLIKTILNDKKFHIVAHSLGSIPATLFAQKYGCKTLTLIAPAGIGLSINKDFIKGMANPSSKAELLHLLGFLGKNIKNLSSEMIENIFIESRNGRLLKLADDIIGTCGQSVNIKTNLASLIADVPTRVLIGRDDEIIRSDDVYDLPAQIAIHSFSTAGHMPHWEFPKDTLKIIS